MKTGDSKIMNTFIKKILFDNQQSQTYFPFIAFIFYSQCVVQLQVQCFLQFWKQT